eukprot:gb/GFBE01031219.1/.p1 GENE.gb/GFBE01031219.1/~~gb/GFBE01031219.1/.p1  ORF type:complete len:146 (+),score=41.87 gb/GFBE01031219.1/:1-438(+)
MVRPRRPARQWPSRTMLAVLLAAAAGCTGSSWVRVPSTCFMQQWIPTQGLGRRHAATAAVAWWVAAGSDTATAEIMRMKLLPLPKAYSESVIAAAKALKDALQAEEEAGDSFIGPEAEAKLAAKEQLAGKLIRSYVSATSPRRLD